MIRRCFPFLCVWLCGLGVAVAEPLCLRAPAAAAALAQLRTDLADARFVAYEPSALAVHDGRVSAADAASIRADLTVLRSHFDALVTYDVLHGAEQIPQIATQLKFRALIIGVWNPLDPAQTAAALEAARRYPHLVRGVSLGNETLFSGRASVGALTAVLHSLRSQAPALPLSTTEPFHMFEQPPANALLGELDFLLVNVHPLFQSWFAQATEATSAQFVVNVLGQLEALYCGPILVKETGLPSGPADEGFSEPRQALFYKELRQRLPPTPQHAFAYFSAFDAPWRAQDDTGVKNAGPHPQEAFWGLFDARRRPKLAVDRLPPLAQDPPTRPHNE